MMFNMASERIRSRQVQCFWAGIVTAIAVAAYRIYVTVSGMAMEGATFRVSLDTWMTNGFILWSMTLFVLAWIFWRDTRQRQDELATVVRSIIPDVLLVTDAAGKICVCNPAAQTIAPKVLDLNDTVAGMLKLLRRLIGEDINLAWEPGANLRPVKFDPSQIDQILANLCVNARDAIAGVGMITLETGTATIDADYCACHPDAIPGAYVFLAVSDDGCGMDRATLAQIFEPFFTTKGIGEGTGLGLSTVYGIIKQNNGLIDVYSEPGKGTTFKIYLPEMAVEVPATIAASQAEAPRGRGETILLVEDEKSVRVTCDAFLNSLGYKAMVAETPGEALKKTNQHPDDIHVLLTDVVMPGMDGRQLAQRISALKPGVKVLFMSGYTADVIAQRGVLDEGIQYLPKPFTRDDLAHKLREVLDPQSGTACIHRLPLTHPDATAPTLDLG
jgi:CheY-like chemotaxis protein